MVGGSAETESSHTGSVLLARMDSCERVSLITKWAAPAPLWLSLCAPGCRRTQGGFTLGPDHAGAQPQMNARLCPLPGRLQGLPSPRCRGFVRGERLHSLYIRKARHTHTHTQFLFLSLWGFLTHNFNLILTLNTYSDLSPNKTYQFARNVITLLKTTVACTKTGRHIEAYSCCSLLVCVFLSP